MFVPIGQALLLRVSPIREGERDRKEFFLCIVYIFNDLPFHFSTRALSQKSDKARPLSPPNFPLKIRPHFFSRPGKIPSSPDVLAVHGRREDEFFGQSAERRFENYPFHDRTKTGYAKEKLVYLGRINFSLGLRTKAKKKGE